MKNLYRITNKKGVTLCMQVARNETEALDAAKMYGARGARYAEFVRAA